MYFTASVAVIQHAFFPCPWVTSFDGQNFSQITTFFYRRAFRNFELSKHITQCASFMKQTWDP